MFKRSFLVSLAVLFVMAQAHASADGERPAPPPPAAPTTVLYASTGVGSVLDTPGGAAPAGTVSIRLALPLARLFALELMGTTGYAIGRGTPDDFWARLALGLRVEDGLRAIRPYASFRLVHLHFAPASIWEDHPGASIAGSSIEGLQHRSGMATAIGLSWAIPRTSMRAMAELEGSWVPIGNGPQWFATTELGLGYVF